MYHKNDFVKFKVKQFASGEYEVKIIERINRDDAVIHWNWFNKDERDLMIVLMQIGSISRQYGDMPITVYTPYLPYARQDRIFEAGQDIAIQTLTDAIWNAKGKRITIETMAIHSISYHCCIYNMSYNLENELFKKYNIVFPDKNARRHYSIESENKNCLYFEKIRGDGGNIYLEMSNKLSAKKNKFLICDDICSGGRTFIKCAEALHKEYGNNIKVELMIYHAFLDYGLDALKEAGISKIYIINSDSYEYICNLYPDDLTYFEYKELK